MERGRDDGGRLSAGGGAAVVRLLPVPAAADRPPRGQVAVGEVIRGRDPARAAICRVTAIGEEGDRRLLDGLVLAPPRGPGAPPPPFRRADEVHLLPEDLNGLDPGLAEDLAFARRAVRRGQVERGERVRIFGAGRVATLIARVAALEGASVVAGAAAEVIFAAEGRAADLAAALRAAGPGRRLVLPPLGAPFPPLDLAALLGRETDLIGCGAPAAEDYEAALALLAFRDVTED